MFKPRVCPAVLLVVSLAAAAAADQSPAPSANAKAYAAAVARAIGFLQQAQSSDGSYFAAG